MQAAVLLMMICLGLAACTPKHNPVQADLLSWTYTDLKALQAPGTANVAQDLIALYTRQRPGELQVRLDLLDMSTTADSDFYLALDLSPGGSTHLPMHGEIDFAWDLLVVSPAGGRPYALNASGEPAVGVINRVNRDALLDEVVFTFNRRALPGASANYSLLAFTAAPGANQLASQIGPVLPDSLPAASEKARLLLEFWNTLPAGSPAQALRRWDGAHTGPLGQRHGLRPLLLAAENSRIPLVLLDLKQPAALSALDALGGLRLVQDLAAQKLLVLPDTAWGDPGSTRGLELSQAAAAAFKLPSNGFVYQPSGYPDVNPYQVVFTSLPGAAQIVQWQDKRLVPVPGDGRSPAAAEEGQPGREGPALAMRIALLSAALSPANGNILIWGGDLPHSTWGDSIVAENTLRYLAAHPWIQVLGEADLLALPVCQEAACLLPCGDGLCQANVNSSKALLARLQDSPPGIVTGLAWNLYLSLSDIQPTEEQQQLRRSYMGQVNVFLEAAQWASRPYSRSDCLTDLNGDGAAECILASPTFFGVFETRGADLALGFTRDTRGNVQQFTGSTAQAAVGLTDASQWKLDAGMAADPGVIPGAFADLPANPQDYKGTALPDGVVFTSPDGKTVKSYRLLPGGLAVSYTGLPAGSVRIPLIIGSDRAYSTGWISLYHSQSSGSTVHWGMDGALSTMVKSSRPLSISTFLDAGSHLQQPENPDWNYPPGHYLPFPLAVVTIQAEGDLSVELTFLP